MKKTVLSICILSGALLIPSCDKFLDVKSYGSVTQDQYFETDQQSIDAIAACYYGLPQERLLGRDMYWEQACVNDFVFGKPRNIATLATMTPTGDEWGLVYPFNACYGADNGGGMNRCNWVIVSLLEKQKKQALTEIETRSLGEAYFLRAYYHFLIAYRYGNDSLGVPYVAYEDVPEGYNNEIPSQTESVMKDYELIISDLQKAEPLVPRFEEYGTVDQGRVHKAAVAAVMAKVYAYWAGWEPDKWPEVITCVDRLENEYGRDLHSSFSDLFSCEFDKFFTKEYCWGLPSYGGKLLAGGGSVEFPGICLVNEGWFAKLAEMGYNGPLMNGWGQFKPTQDIYEEMAKDNWETDASGKPVKNERLAKSILEYGDHFPYMGFDFVFYDDQWLSVGFQIGKFMDAFKTVDCIGTTVMDNPDWPCTRINWPLIRFADCLLLRAEANLMAGNAAAAAKDINRIRRRAHLKEIGSTATWTDLYHERRCELAFELAADHAYDCKRWALFGPEEIKALALRELEDHPRVRHHTNRTDPYSPYTVGPYEDYTIPAKEWSKKKLTFPYPTSEVVRSAGKLKNVPEWQ